MVPSGMRRCGRGRKRRGSAMEVAASGARLGDAARARSGPAAVVGEQRWPPGGVGAGIGARRRRLDLGLKAALGLDAARSGAQGYDRCDAACLELVCWFLHMVRRSLVMLVVEDDPELQVLGRARGEKKDCVPSAVQGVGVPRHYDHNGEVLRRRSDPTWTVAPIWWAGMEMCGVMDANPYRLRSVLTAPVDVAPLLGGVAEVCRHPLFLLGLLSPDESLDSFSDRRWWRLSVVTLLVASRGET